MRVRCGSCRTQFEVAGAGRFACPVCGSVNVVRGAPTEESAGGPTTMGGYQAAPGVGGMPPGAAAPPPPPEQPMPKIKCPECDFTFIVGLVPKVSCPMCAAEVATGIEEDE